MPASTGLRPKPTWNKSGSRNGVALIATRKMVPAASVEMAKVSTLNEERSSSGCGARRRCRAASQETMIPATISSTVGKTPSSGCAMRSRP